MTDRQKLELRLSETRSRLNVLRSQDDLTDADRAEMDGLVSAYPDLERQYRSALIEEDSFEASPPVDSETRERRALQSRARVHRYVASGIEGRAVDGAEGELNAALGIAAEGFPLRLLAPEVRATTDTDAGSTARRWLDRLFADTAAMHLGVTFDSVGAGVASYPVTTAGAGSAQRGRGQAAADAAWTVGVSELKPTRNSVRAVFSIEDAARLSGLEQALRRDLRMALTEKVDRTIFRGDSTANENVGDITGLQTAGITEFTLTQANKVKPANTVAEFAALIDGKHAASMADLRIVTSVGTNTLWLSTIANSAAENQTLAQFLAASGMSWMARGEIDTNTANGDFGAYVGLGRGITGAGVAAVWDSAMLIRDPYSNAAKGEVALTMSHLWAFGLPRPSNFRRLKFVS